MVGKIFSKISFNKRKKKTKNIFDMNNKIIALLKLITNLF